MLTHGGIRQYRVAVRIVRYRHGHAPEIEPFERVLDALSPADAEEAVVKPLLHDVSQDVIVRSVEQMR